MRKINDPLAAGWWSVFPALATCTGTHSVCLFKGNFAEHETIKEKDYLIILTIISSEVERDWRATNPPPKCPRQIKLRAVKD